MLRIANQTLQGCHLLFRPLIWRYYLLWRSRPDAIRAVLLTLDILKQHILFLRIRILLTLHNYFLLFRSIKIHLHAYLLLLFLFLILIILLQLLTIYQVILRFLRVIIAGFVQFPIIQSCCWFAIFLLILRKHYFVHYYYRNWLRIIKETFVFILSYIS